MRTNVLTFSKSREDLYSANVSAEVGQVTEEVLLTEDIGSEPNLNGIVGQSSALRRVLQLVEIVAASDATVLLLGETGTGKELIARAIHERSARRKETFMTLNCAAIPNSLFESELFGHERGAFTGAHVQQIGRLELANRGTLFLDEVGDLPLELQPKLLRALQERAYERVGSARTRSVDVRLVAATNCDLEQKMSEKQFRCDLYYRLNVFPIQLPPLRERREDIPLLVQHFTRKYAREMGKHIATVPAATLQKLQRWHWPGNVRELRNLIERSVILSRNSVLAISLPDKMNGAINSTAVVGNHEEQLRIEKALKEANGCVSGPKGAARRLGVKRSTLLYRMKRLGIDAKAVKSDLAYSAQSD
jgi:formate hydrogenlyase transcriptional activator